MLAEACHHEARHRASHEQEAQHSCDLWRVIVEWRAFRRGVHIRPLLYRRAEYVLDGFSCCCKPRLLPVHARNTEFLGVAKSRLPVFRHGVTGNAVFELRRGMPVTAAKGDGPYEIVRGQIVEEGVVACDLTRHVELATDGLPLRFPGLTGHRVVEHPNIIRDGDQAQAFSSGKPLHGQTNGCRAGGEEAEVKPLLVLQRLRKAFREPAGAFPFYSQ